MLTAKPFGAPRWPARLPPPSPATIFPRRCLDKGQFDESIRLSQEVLAGQPGDLRRRTISASLFWKRAGSRNPLPHFQRAIAAQPNAPIAYYNLGRACLKKQSYEAAMDQFPNRHPPATGLCQRLLQPRLRLAASGPVPAAISNYQQSIALEPDYALAHNDLGGILLRLGDTNQARIHFERAVALAPEFVEARYNLGGLLLAAGQLDEALSQYEKVAQLRPRLAEAHFMMGKLAAAYARAGRPDRAVAVATRALDLARAAGEASLAENLAAQVQAYQAAASTTAKP
jgi:tetratricopeptide (TPR) repeat protein